MKLALFTPLNPQRTGISDYIEELLPHLAPEFELIDLFIEYYEPESSYIREHFRYNHYLLFEREYGRRKYDAIFYQMGNSEFHTYMMGFVQRFPGVMLLHDFNLHHMMAEMFKHLPDRSKYLDEAMYCHGGLCRNLLSTTMEYTYQEYQLFYYPMNRRVIESAQSLIVHSRAMEQSIRSAFPGKPVMVVPHHFRVDHTIGEKDADDLRRRYGVSENDLLVICIGNVIPSKEPVKIAEVCNRVSRDIDHMVLVFAGNVNPSVDTRKILQYSSDRLKIIITGYLSKKEFETWLHVMDMGVNLRYPTTGETSGSLVKAMGLGKPLVISDLEQYRELPEDVCIRINIGDEDGRELERSIRRLARDRDFRNRMGYNAKKYTADNHRIEDSAAKIAGFIKQPVAAALGKGVYDTGFLAKLSKFKFLDNLAQEIMQLSDDSHTDEIVDTLGSTIAEFED